MTDAWVRYTKKIIQDSFLHLLRDKPLGKITVKEICQLAEINRATFYRYYADVYALMENIEAALLTELNDFMQTTDHQNLAQTFETLLEAIAQNGEVYQTLTSEYGDPSFPAQVLALCAEVSIEDITKLHPELSRAQCSWLYAFTAQGANGVLQCWINQGRRESAREVAGFLSELLKSLK